MSNNGIKSLVTDLRPIEHQVGAHTLAALSQPGTAAVLTSIVPGLGRDRVASIPISQEQLFMIQQLLQQDQMRAITEERPPEDEDRSIGFQIDVPVLESENE